jgi:hypothetical protein
MPKPAAARRCHHIGVHCSQRWYEWVVRFAESQGSDASDLIASALRKHAKANSFVEPPARLDPRIGRSKPARTGADRRAG